MKRQYELYFIETGEGEEFLEACQ